ncbi:MAG: alpha/beta hydrolase [Acidimicrobiales bacterium]
MSTRTEHTDGTIDESLHPSVDDDGITVVPDERPSPSRGARFQPVTDHVAAALEPIWGDRRIAAAAAFGAGALWGALAGWWTPRGPLTTSQAIWSIVISLAIGATAGIITRSRWAMLAAPVVFASVFELVRFGTDGPTVDGISTSTYGLIALVVGRGFHALISLLPLAFGALIGAAAARQLATTRSVAGTGRRWWRYTRRGGAVLAGLGLLAFTALLARPASTDPIVDADGIRIPGSIAELTTVDVNGHNLTMLIRGHSVDNPVLLFLAGGPGGSEMGAMRKHLPRLEENFTVVTWDQRGTGHAYDQLDPTDTVTLDGAIDDTLAVTNYLRDRFGQEKIYVLGQSWGSTLGVLAVQQQPGLYTAFIGTGQMVSQLATDTIFYEDTLVWAQTTGRTGLVADLLSIGAPPYSEMLNYETALANEQDVYPYDHSPNSEGRGQMSENLIVEEYALIDQVHILGAFMDTFSVLYPQLQGIDFRETATDFEIPMFFVQGAHEADGRAEVFADWYPMVDAPVKDLVVLDTSGHRALWEQPDEFVDYMTNTVLAQTSNAD